jgi:hypothetical protein
MKTYKVMLTNPQWRVFDIQCCNLRVAAQTNMVEFVGTDSEPDRVVAVFHLSVGDHVYDPDALVKDKP